MTDKDREELPQQVRVMQMIAGAMVMGVLTFAIVMPVAIRPQIADREPVIAYLGVALAMVGTLLGIMVPRLIAARMPPTLQTYQTTLIVGAAIFEAAAFFNLVAYMLDGQVYSVAVAALMLVFLLLTFPTVRGVENWITERERRDREKQTFTSQ